jgi:hypothetical protein
MPNGGYPMHLHVRLPDSHTWLAVSGTRFSVVRDSGDEKDREELLLTPEQVEGLLYHLSYWWAHDHAEHAKPRPQYDARGLIYDL